VNGVQLLRKHWPRTHPKIRKRPSEFDLVEQGMSWGVEKGKHLQPIQGKESSNKPLPFKERASRVERREMLASTLGKVQAQEGSLKKGGRHWMKRKKAAL